MARWRVALVALVAWSSVLGSGMADITNPEACTNTNPSNDCFRFAITMTARSFQASVSNVQATVELGEPLGPDMANTVWWKFTATYNGSGSFTTSGSNHQSGHSVYELLPGSKLKLLDHASGQTAFPWTIFTCVKGTTYYVQGGGEEGATGILDLAGTACVPVPPPAPTLQVAPGAARGEVALTWTSNGDGDGPLTSWTVQRGDAACGSFASIATLAPTASSHVDAGLAEGAARCWRVAASNAAGLGAWSVARATAPLGVPTVPRSVNATGGDGHVALQHLFPSFDGGSPATGFRVYGADAPGGPFTLLYEAPGTTSTEAGLPDGVTRHYRIHALNAFGESPGVAASARTWAVPTPPRNAQAGWDVPYGIRLTWQAPLDTGGIPVLEYHILRAPEGGVLSHYATVSGTTLLFRDRPMFLDAYDYAVVAVNAKGASARSNVDCGQSVPMPPLPLVEHC